MTRCAPRDRRARPARDQPRGAARRARQGRLRRLRLPQRRLPGGGARPRAARGDRRRRQERGDRGGLGDRQGDARPLHAARRRRRTRAGSSPSTWATPPPSTATRSSGSACRRCTGCRSSRRPTSSWRWPASASSASRPRAPRRSERALQVLDREQPAVAVERHADRVEAQLVGVRADRRARSASCRPSCAPARAWATCSASNGPARDRRLHPAGLDLAERQRAAVECDDVELAPAGAVVALDDLKAAPDQVLGGELLAELSEAAAGVVGHRADATPRSRDTWVTRVLQLCAGDRRAGCAELAHRVTHVSRDDRVASRHARPHRHVRDRRGRSAPGVGRGRTSAPGCPRSRSSGSPTPRCASRATGSTRRSSTRASSSRPAGSPPTSRRRSCARSGPGSTPRWRSAVLAASGQIPSDALAAYAVFGELSLSGELRDSPGALAVAEGARRAGLTRLIVPRERAREAALVEGLEVAGVSSLRAAADVVVGRAAAVAAGRRRPSPVRGRPSPTWPTSAATRCRCWRCRSPPPAATTCCSRGRPAPARRCSPAGCRRSCRG